MLATETTPAQSKQMDFFPVEEYEVEEATASEAKKLKGNPMMKPLCPDMLTNPVPLDFVGGMLSNEFALNKMYKLIIEPLQFDSEEACVEFAKEAWRWKEGLQSRKFEKKAETLLSKMPPDIEVKKALLEKLRAELGE